MPRAIAAALLIVGPAAAVAQPAGRTPISATFHKPDGKPAGVVMVWQEGGSIMLRATGRRLRSGRHGVHVHAVGRCEGPGFESAGPHWNPTARQHGRLNPAGHHLGDLPNLEIGAHGAGQVRFAIPGATLADLLDADGASIVIHAAPDDERTDPSGNSGTRIACAVLARR